MLYLVYTNSHVTIKIYSICIGQQMCKDFSFTYMWFTGHSLLIFSLETLLALSFFVILFDFVFLKALLSFFFPCLWHVKIQPLFFSVT